MDGLDLKRLTARQAAALLAGGQVSASELHAAYSDRIAAYDGQVGAFLRLTPYDGAAGVPIAVKDCLSTSGVETTSGSRILAGYVPPFDATVVSKLKEAGLSMLGKTNLDEFAMGSSTENSGFHFTHNPWDLSCVPGGSSGGSAAAVAAGFAPWALGSDTGGSVKQPAALCGLVGLRPTYGTVSRYGLIAFASSLDIVGPLAKTVDDCAWLYSLIKGRDARDATSVASPDTVLPSGLRSLAGLRIGVPKELNEGAGVAAAVRDAVSRAITLAAQLGAHVEECSLPLSSEYALACYYLIAPAEVSSNLARFDGVRYGLRINGDSVDEMYARTRAAGFGDEVKRRIILGTYALSAGYYDAYYGQAQKLRQRIKEEFAAAFDRYDLLLSPTSPTAAWKLGAKVADPLQMYAQDVMTIPPNLAGLPAINLPCGLDGHLPVGLQLIAPPFAENALFAAAAALEAAIGFDTVAGGVG